MDEPLTDCNEQSGANQIETNPCVCGSADNNDRICDIGSYCVKTDNTNECLVKPSKKLHLWPKNINKFENIQIWKSVCVGRLSKFFSFFESHTEWEVVAINIYVTNFSACNFEPIWWKWSSKFGSVKNVLKYSPQ